MKRLTEMSGVVWDYLEQYLTGEALERAHEMVVDFAVAKAEEYNE